MCYLSFGVIFFSFLPPFLTVGQFLGVTPNQLKKTIRFLDAKLYAESFEQKNYLKTIIISEACKTLKIDGVFWSNLKYLKKFWAQ